MQSTDSEMWGGVQVVGMNRKVNKSMVRYGASMVLFYQALMGLMYECFVIAPDTFRKLPLDANGNEIP